MNDIVSLPKSLQDRIKRLSRSRNVTPGSLVREAVADRIAYMEWEEKALAQGQAELDNGRVMTTEQLRAALLAGSSWQKAHQRRLSVHRGRTRRASHRF